MMKKYIVKYILECETGLQIQAGSTSFDIGGLDNPVIKNPITGEPYIPGSSLKGKMRCLLEWMEAPEEIIRGGGKVLNDPRYDVCKLFGVAPSNLPEDKDNENTQEKILITRAIVRDAYLTKESKETLQSYLGENLFTEIKTENNIDRLTSKQAQEPLKGFQRTQFEGEIVLTQYVEEDERLLDLLLQGMKLLEDNYLGGSGSRGPGKLNSKI